SVAGAPFGWLEANICLTLGERSRLGCTGRRRIWLAWSLRDRTERDVYVAPGWQRRMEVVENPRARKLRTVKRPEGRAPAQIIVAALNTYSAPRRPDRVFCEGEQVVDIRAATRAVFDGAAEARRAIWL